MINEDFDRQVRRTAFLTVALLALIVFGVIVPAEGDWIPGGVVVASALTGEAVNGETRNRTEDTTISRDG